MNPFDILGGAGAAGGLSAGSSASGQSGPADGSNTTGNKIFNLGGTGNPNTAAGMLQNPVVLIAIVAAVYLVAKK